MELGEAIARRRMCRAFEDRPLPGGTLDRLLDRARRAPSAGHTQGWSFLVLEGSGETERFWRATSDEEWLRSKRSSPLRRAPAIVVPLTSPGLYLERYSRADKASQGLSDADAWPVAVWTVDVSFATMLLLLSATEEGLGALFFRFRSEAAIARCLGEFGVPLGWEPIGAVALGWPDGGGGPRGSASTRPLRDVREVVRRGRW